MTPPLAAEVLVDACRRGRAAGCTPSAAKRSYEKSRPLSFSGSPLTIAVRIVGPDHPQVLERVAALAPGDEVRRGDHVLRDAVLRWSPRCRRRDPDRGTATARASPSRTTLKIAAVAPMPIASVASAASVNPGARHRTRAPKRMSRMESSRSAGLIWSRVSSWARTTPPNRSTARRLASPGSHAVADVLLGLLIDVKLQLLVESAFERVAAGRSIGSIARPAPGDWSSSSHPGSVAPRTRLTARDVRCQYATSSLNCRRPSRVSE